jgi:hypothetical protein
MNKEKLKDIKLFIGPMSKNVVDGVIKYCELNNVMLGLIPSRRQIDYNSGYVNNWNTKSFSEYIHLRTNKIVIERDHGGPEQGYDSDNGIMSFGYDSLRFDIIHVDVWKKYKNINDGIEKTIDYINFCSNPDILFEIGTEESIKKISSEELNTLIQKLKENLEPEVFDKIVYAVIQSGTSLLENKNTGQYDVNRLKEMVSVCKHYNLLSKEHNGDFINVEDIYSRFDNGLDAINIAPEFGRIETDTILDLINNDKILFEQFYQICLESDRWKKWVSSSFNPENNKKELIKICGHYVLSDNKTKEILNKFDNIDILVQDKVINKIDQILNRK